MQSAPIIIQYERPFLYPKQEGAFFCPERYSYSESSTKAGKTHGCITWIVELALLQGFDGWNGWWVAPTLAQAKIAMRRIKRACPKSYIKTNETERYHEFPNGAKIWFKSAEDPDNLYGEDVHAAVFDEASRGRYDSWVALRSTLTSTKGPIRLIGNVKGKANWFYLECRKVEREKGSSNRKFTRITAYDAVKGSVLDLEEVEDAKRILPEVTFGELYLAKAADDDDAFLLSDYVEKAMERSNVRPFGPLIIGADPSQGRGDPAAFCFRRGPVVSKIEEHPTMDEFGFIAHVLRLIEVEKPVRVNVDATGFGATIVKSIHRDYPALEQIVKGFHMQERSAYPDEYGNKRAECWGEGRKWLQSVSDPPQMPDDEGFAIELCCIHKKEDSSGRVLLEGKKELKARGYDSPNKGDAWGLTFADKVEFYNEGKIKYPEARKRRVMS